LIFSVAFNPAQQARTSVPGPSPHSGEIAIVERRVTRAVIAIPGRYALANRRNTRGERREFACRTISVSTEHIELAGPVTGPVGERVIAHFDELGKIEGLISSLIDDGFVMRLMLPKNRRAWLATKIEWLDKHKHHNLPDDRIHKRIIPKKSRSTMLLNDGTMRVCFVIDMSVTGVAVSSELSPNLGDVLAVGKIVGRVVRIFPQGFAVRFIELQDPELLEQWLIQS
jgi:hypothetical protein